MPDRSSFPVLTEAQRAIYVVGHPAVGGPYPGWKVKPATLRMAIAGGAPELWGAPVACGHGLGTTAGLYVCHHCRVLYVPKHLLTNGGSGVGREVVDAGREVLTHG